MSRSGIGRVIDIKDEPSYHKVSGQLVDSGQTILTAYVEFEGGIYKWGINEGDFRSGDEVSVHTKVIEEDGQTREILVQNRG